MSNKWSHLPNAHHIDWVLSSLNENPELWNSARDADWDAAWYAAWYAARSADRDAVWDAAWDASWDADRDAADRAAAWCAISALVAYDDCDHFLTMNFKKLKVWAVLSEDPRSVLLLPMVYVKEKLNECMVTSA